MPQSKYPVITKESTKERMVTPALGTTPETTMIGVLGVKGGVGTTTVSVNLACALAQLRAYQVTLFDANVQQPDAACLLNRHPRFSILDLLSRQTLDDELLAACCESLALDGKGTLRLISPPSDAGQALQIESRDITNLLAALKEQSQPAYWVVDLPRNIDSHLVATLDLMSHIVLVLEGRCPPWLPQGVGLKSFRTWVMGPNVLSVCSIALAAK